MRTMMVAIALAGAAWIGDAKAAAQENTGGPTTTATVKIDDV